MRLVQLVLFTLFCGFARAGDLPTEELDLLLHAMKGGHDIAGVVAHLPSSLREEYTLMQNSLSLQSASPLEPRAILFGHTAKLILTFNGAAHQLGYDALEVAIFDEHTQRIHFREFIFAPHDQVRTLQEKVRFSKDHDLEFSDIAGKIGKFVYTHPNPNKCLQCHAMSPSFFPASAPHAQRVAKYIWPEYKRWTMANGASEAYGLADDEIRFSATETLTTEANNYVAFRQAARNHDRYRHLAYDESEFKGYPFWGMNRNATELDPNLHRASLLPASMPNLKLSLLLTVNFARQMRHIFAQDPVFRKAAPEVALEACYTGSTQSLEPKHRPAYDSLANYLKAQYGDIDTFRVDRQGEAELQDHAFSPMPNRWLYRKNNISLLEYILESSIIKELKTRFAHTNLVQRHQEPNPPHIKNFVLPTLSYLDSIEYDYGTRWYWTIHCEQLEDAVKSHSSSAQ